jgi:hypothetical protein
MNDKNLTSKELRIKWGTQCPKYPIGAWRTVVYECDTTLGYWDWVVAQLARTPIKYTYTVEVVTSLPCNPGLAVEALRDAIVGNKQFPGTVSITSND